ncbi:hypothetical protein L3Y34_000582 [Caenorhabditis briggsae]|uniref:Uncharacterized protein n=1 Tax=Caenorhabditis briggsae TaxID=6238 RepID=A0AAE9D9S3_CAEBR|nr:hypothetical protein L3Y34_000582 [Caenorhabditis briggsae]
MKIWKKNLKILEYIEAEMNGYTVSVNSNRKFLFGDVLEPLCSIDTNGEVLSKSDVVQLFHAWENLTSSQIATSSKISDYRKAMPCFPGPSLEIPISNEDLLPPYPNCPTFVNISTATIEEVEDLIQEIQKQKTVQQMDISLKSVANSLSNRLQNLVDFLPEGETKRKVEVYHSQLLQMSTHEQDNSTTPPIAENYNTPQSYKVVTASGNSKISNNDEENDVKVSEEALEDVTPSENLKTPKSRRNDNSEDVPDSGETAEDVTPSRSSKNPKIEKREDSEEVDFSRSSETPKLKGNDDSEDVTSLREPPEDVTPSETPKTTNSKNCGTSGNLVTVDGVTIFNCEDSEDVTNPSIQNLEISKFLSEINETVLEDSSKNHFDEALNFFKSHVTFSESDDDVIQNLLNSTLNSTILEYGASFLNESSDLRRIILDILPHLPQEFTVGQLLEKLGIQNLASVPESLITFLGSIKETSGNSNSSKSPELTSNKKLLIRYIRILEGLLSIFQ